MRMRWSVATAAAAASQAILAAQDVAAGGTDELPLPTEKLACHRNAALGSTPVVLVAAGSFNPVTHMHLRMYELAREELLRRGYDVWGGYLSPVADAYGKHHLAPVAHRLAMCQLATEASGGLMVDGWEASRPGYTRTLQVLQRVSEQMQRYVHGGRPPAVSQAPASEQEAASSEAAGVANGAAHEAATASSAQQPPQSQQQQQQQQQAEASSSGRDGTQQPQQQDVRVMLLCGADLLASMEQPGVWRGPDLVLQRHGVVCIARNGTELQPLLQRPGGLLAAHRDQIIVIEDPVPNALSSTRVREQLAQGRTVKYLLPDAVLDYIQRYGLYRSDGRAAQ